MLLGRTLGMVLLVLVESPLGWFLCSSAVQLPQACGEAAVMHENSIRAIRSGSIISRSYIHGFCSAHTMPRRSSAALIAMGSLPQMSVRWSV